jgi:subtilase family serine protease
LEPDLRPSLKLFLPAAVVALLAAAPPLATASTPRTHVQAPSVALAGSVLPSVQHSARLGTARATASVRVSLILRPSHPALLARMAAQSSGKPGLSQALIDGLFRPAPDVRAQVAAYMRSRGFAPAGSGFLAMAFTGTAAQADAAFGVTLANYRLASGITYRAPSGAVHLPAALVSRVIAVDGLSTLPLEQPAGVKHAKQQPHISPGAPCGQAMSAHTGGSLLPAQLAAANAYDSQTLLNNNDDGTGENVALVEFSNYASGDPVAYQSCFNTHVPVQRVSVNGGNLSTAGGDEVALDQEVLAGEAPGLQRIYTYVAPSSGTMAGMLDSMITRRKAEHLTIISDSWGSCESAQLPSSQAATDKELQIIAVAGVSFFAASGDDGSADCERYGIHTLLVDDPADQPYATGVGGTNLHPGGSEVVWGGHASSRGGGGGGVSEWFTMPSWQKGPGVIRSGLSSKKKCGGKTHWCREVPDVAFDADPRTGYVIYCTTASCASSPHWNIIGGTSAAAPLMAAFTADANTFSLANGGTRMGFANLFLYHEFASDPSMFHDITSGNNNINGSTAYTAEAGYDMASGLGSIDVNEMATDLAAYTRLMLTDHGTKITGGASRNPIPVGGSTVLSGKLTDTTSHTVLGGRLVIVQGDIRGANFNPHFWFVHTGKKGGWSLRLTHKKIPRRFTWAAIYLGEQGHRPALTPVRTIKGS